MPTMTEPATTSSTKPACASGKAHSTTMASSQPASMLRCIKLFHSNNMPLNGAYTIPLLLGLLFAFATKLPDLPILGAVVGCICWYLLGLILRATASSLDRACNYNLKDHQLERRDGTIVSRAPLPIAAFVLSSPLYATWLALLYALFGTIAAAYGISVVVLQYVYALGKQWIAWPRLMRAMGFSLLIPLAASCHGVDPVGKASVWWWYWWRANSGRNIGHVSDEILIMDSFSLAMAMVALVAASIICFVVVDKVYGSRDVGNEINSAVQ